MKKVKKKYLQTSVEKGWNSVKKTQTSNNKKKKKKKNWQSTKRKARTSERSDKVVEKKSLTSAKMWQTGVKKVTNWWKKSD